MGLAPNPSRVNTRHHVPVPPPHRSHQTVRDKVTTDSDDSEGQTHYTEDSSRSQTRHTDRITLM